MPDATRCHVFIGSSSEGVQLARALQRELLSDCEVELWSQGVFEAGGYTLDSLINEAKRCDFAVLVATPDDVLDSRGQSSAVPRDNVILEFGLFAGVLGRDRTLLLASGGVKLPTDVLGITRLAYHEQSNLQAAVSEAAHQVRQRMNALGQTERASSTHAAEPRGDGVLQAELERLIQDAICQGWSVKNTSTALRLTSPKRKTLTLTKSRPDVTRNQLRKFVAQARAQGLRVSASIRRPPEESPFSRNG